MSRSGERAAVLTAALVLASAILAPSRTFAQMPSAPSAQAPAASSAQPLAARTAQAHAASATQAASRKPWRDLGRAATANELKAWDIDVRADFKGLPPGSGSVARGQEIWESKCASCHGVFGESTEVFAPIVGGTTKEDIRTGNVANLQRADYPQRTTMMKLATVSTLWDYINRAMPWNAPKSLAVDEVYSVVAYILSLAEVVPNEFVLSDSNIAEVQRRLPNRNGLVRYDGLWHVRGKPDVQGDACMRDCPTQAALRSSLPDHARGSHGNLAEQARPFGPVRAQDTSRPARTAFEPIRPGTPGDASRPATRGSARADPAQLAREANCLSCHASDHKLVGPSFRDVAAKYGGNASAEDKLVERVRSGSQGIWGPIAMPANADIRDEDLRAVVRWILNGAGT